MKLFPLNKLALVALFATVALTACEDKAPIVKEVEEAATTTETIVEQANKIAQATIIIDTHIDVPYRLVEEYEDVSKATTQGDFDYPRAVKGGLNAPFMSIYIPSKLQKTGGSKELADKLIDDVEVIVEQSPNKFALAYSTTQVKENFAKGIISLPMGMENGSPIAGDLANLQHFYDRGIRYITLAHAKTNHISDSSYDENRPAQGLTEFGKKLVVAMNNVGVIVDISHVSDQAFYQVMAISKVPAIASHSSARFFTPGFERNMSDDMIKLLAKNGGVIQMTFSGIFTSQKFREQSAVYKPLKAEFIKANNLNEELPADESKIDAFEEAYKLENPYHLGTLALVLDHFDHVIKLVGIDHVGIGSDFDGVSGILPEALRDVASYPNLIAGLLERGYSEEEIKKLLSGNIMRVWQQVEDYAAMHKTP